MVQHTSTNRLHVVIAFTLVYILWGSTYLAIAIAVEHLPPLVMGGTRFVAAGALMLAYRAMRGHTVAVSMRDLFRLTVVGSLLLITGNVVLGWAETYIPTGLAALLIAISPLWFLLLERFSHEGDHLPARGLAGIGLGVLGVVVLLWPDLTGNTHLERRQLIGAGLVLFSSMNWASGSVLAKRWRISIDPFTASGWQMLMAGLISSVLALACGDLHRTVWARNSMLAIFYLIIAGSLVGFTAYVWLLKHVPTPKVATYAYVNPVVALFLGWAIHGEKMTGYMYAGAAVVIVGVILVTGAKLKPRPEPIRAKAAEGSAD